MSLVADKIIEVASRYVGIKELGDNQGFTDKAFEADLTKLGWHTGWAWCVFAAEKVWIDAYRELGASEAFIKRLRKLFNPSAQKTFKQFSEANDFKVVNYPEKGAIAIWATGRYTGHAALVDIFDEKCFNTFEGNTDVRGTRDGDGFYKSRRQLRYKDSFRLLGFILPSEDYNDTRNADNISLPK